MRKPKYVRGDRTILYLVLFLFRDLYLYVVEYLRIKRLNDIRSYNINAEQQT